MKLSSRQEVREMGEKFLEMWRESIIVQSIMTLMFGGTLCACYLVPLFRGVPLNEVDLPQTLVGFTGLILGYWFKKKDEVNRQQRAAKG